jgi:CRISPR-associated protein Csb2
MRALYDAWKRKHAEVPEAAIEELLRALAVEAPSYRLPLATASHTRSYLNSNTLDPTEKSLIFDAFLAMAPKSSLFVTWPNVNLTPVQNELLARLLGGLNYLGRSESWVDAQLHTGTIGEGLRCEPMMENDEGGDLVAVACAVPAEGYSEKRPWMDALAYSTADFQKERRSLPPAMRMVPYVRAKNAVSDSAPKPRRTHVGVQTVMLSLNARVLPLVTATVEVAEQVRVRLMGIHRVVVGDPAKVSVKFSGKTADGQPLKNHHHAFILPLQSEKDPIRIDRVLLHTRAPEGFVDDEVRAILRLTGLYGRTPEDPIRVMATQRACVGVGDEIRKHTPIAASTTPFCAGRHWRKGRGEYVDFLTAEIRRECTNHGLPEPRSVKMVPASAGSFEWVEFRRNRKGDEPRPGYGFRLEFDEPVPVPFSLGYGCHYGLGQFAAAR